MTILRICSLLFCLLGFYCKKSPNISKEDQTSSTEIPETSTDTKAQAPKPTDTVIVITENAEFLDSQNKVKKRKPKGTVLNVVPPLEKVSFLEISGRDPKLRIKRTAVRVLKKTNIYDAENIEESAIQALVFIFSLEYGLFQKYQFNPIPKKACLGHFQQGYIKEIAKGFADHWCKEDETTLDGTDDFLDGPLLNVRFLRKIDVEEVELCATNLREEGTTTTVDTMKKVGNRWKITGGQAIEC
jgi:hypothetical protein